MINKIKSLNSNRPYITKLVILLLFISVILFLISYFGFYTINSSYYGFKNQYKFGYCSEVRDHGFRLSATFPEIRTTRNYFISDNLIDDMMEKSIDRYAALYPDKVTAEDRNENGDIDYKKFVENHRYDPLFKDLVINYLYFVKYKEADLENMETFINNLLHYINEFERREINRKYKISSATLFYEIISNDKDLLCEHLFEYYLNK